MGSWQLSNIGIVVSSLAELTELSVEEQAFLFLRWLATRYPTSQQSISAHRPSVPYGNALLGSAFSSTDRDQAEDLLFGAPWHHLLQLGLIATKHFGQFFIVTQAGYEAAKTEGPGSDRAIIRQILRCLKLLHPDLRGYSTYFRAGKYKEAVAAAFERYENKLNEARDGSRKRSVRGASGGDLVYALYNEKVLKRPYARLGSTPTKKEALHKAFTGFLCGAIGWIRNPYTHEKHHLPETTAPEALELPFVASYLMGMIDKSKSK
jgi:hypothetical protein